MCVFLPDVDDDVRIDEQHLRIRFGIVTCPLTVIVVAMVGSGAVLHRV
jgi:hypothetical protein